MSSETMKKILGEKPVGGAAQTEAMRLEQPEMIDLLKDAMSGDFSNKNADLMSRIFGMPKDKMFFRGDKQDALPEPSTSTMPADECPGCVMCGEDEGNALEISVMNVLDGFDWDDPAEAHNVLSMVMMSVFRHLEWDGASKVAHAIWMRAL